MNNLVIVSAILSARAVHAAKLAHKWDNDVFSPNVRFTYQVVRPYAWAAFRATAIALVVGLTYCYLKAPVWFGRAVEDTYLLCTHAEVAISKFRFYLVYPDTIQPRLVAWLTRTVAPAIAQGYQRALGHAKRQTMTFEEYDAWSDSVNLDRFYW